MERTAPSPLRNAVATILREILDGSSPEAGWLLNPRDPGLLRSLERISAADASSVPPAGTASIASHVEHLRYGLSLLNRASGGENPFTDADWSAAWRTTGVSGEEWHRLREGLRAEAAAWQQGFAKLIDAGEIELTGVLASAAHLAYHLGAIRQMSPSARGPSAFD